MAPSALAKAGQLVVRPLGALAAGLTRLQGNLYAPPNNTIAGVSDTNFPTALQPVRPFGNENTKPLGMNLQMGQNLIFTPRPDARYTTPELQMYAMYPLARICIEMVKNIVADMPWKIQLKSQPGENQKERETKQLKDDTIQKLTEFINKPNADEDFKTFTRRVLEDMLVCDAGSILLRYDAKGVVYEWRAMEGAYITRLVDDQGYTPQPPSPAYQQLWEGMPLVDLSTDQLIYRPRNICYRVGTISYSLYGLSPTEFLAPEIEVGIQRLQYVTAFYKDGSVPNVLWVVAPDAQPDKVQEAMTFLNARLAGNLEQRRKIQFAQGFVDKGEDKIHQFKEPELADSYDDLHIRKVAAGYGVSAQRLLKTQNRACYSADTETLTENGWRKYNEIQDEEKIAQFNPETGNIEFVQPDGLFVYPYAGEMMHFKSQNVDVLVTPEHKMWVSQLNGRTRKYSEYRKLRADALKRPIKFLASAKFIGAEEDHFVIPPVKNGQVKLSNAQLENIYAHPQERANDLADRFGVCTATVHYARRVKRSMPAYTAPIEVVMDDWLEFLGYYLSEGGLCHDKRSPFLTLCQKEGPDADKMGSCLSRIPIHSKQYTKQSDGMVRWNVHGKAIWKWLLEKTGGYAFNKRIPRQFLNLSVRQLSILFDAMMLGDGSWDTRTNRTCGAYYTTSSGLAEDVQELAFKLGYCASISSYLDTRPTITKTRDRNYRVCISERSEHTLGKESNIVREAYEGPVYCFRVPTGLFVTRRNGKIAIQGNTAQSNQEAAEEEGLAPYLGWYAGIINEIIQGKMGYTKYEFVYDTSRDPDPTKQSAMDKQDVAGGIETINGARIRRGWDTISDPAADVLAVTTPQGRVPIGQPVVPKAPPGGGPQNVPGGGAVPPKPAPNKIEKVHTEPYKYGLVAINIPADSEAGAAMLEFGRTIGNEKLAGDGLEENPHITVRYGLKGDSDIAGIVSYLSSLERFDITFGLTDLFEPSEHSDGAAPLFVTIDAEVLGKINADLEQHGEFKASDFDYHPHATIAYLAPDHAKDFTGNAFLAGKTFTVESMSVRPKDGDPVVVPLKGTKKYRKVTKSAPNLAVIDPSRDSIRTRSATSKMQSVFTNFFHHLTQNMVIVRKPVAKVRKSKKDDDKQIEEIVDAIMASIDWNPIPSAIEEALEDAGLDGVSTGLDQVERMQQVKSGEPITLTVQPVRVVTQSLISETNRVAMDYAKERSAELVGMKYVDGELVTNPNAKWAITDSTRNMLRDIVTEAFSKDTPLNEIVQDIKDAGVFSDDRAKMIAQTEIKFAQVGGNYASWKKSGLVKKVRSLLSANHIGPDECDENAEAGPIAFGTNFPSGQAHSPFHPRCQCSVQAVEIGGLSQKW